MSLLAVCYRYLGEGRLMEKTLGDAVELLRDDMYEKTYTLGEMTDPKRLKEAAHDMFSVVASWMNPATTRYWCRRRREVSEGDAGADDAAVRGAGV